ncbi:MAG: AAA family ATPase [Candidatus Delongbacteria bacterium]|nr:AAA family ATPase [Candidatus Delongbacteria bacterium]
MGNTYTNEPAFINRKKEVQFLNNWVKERSKNLLFVYGPKSSGKTTLLYRLINNEWKDNRKFDVKHINLRTILISNYNSFIQTFFNIDYSKDKSDVKEKREYNAKVFKLTVETFKGIDEKLLDPFEVMEQELKLLNKKGIKPIIVIDELQALENIYMTDQRELLKELFNFFVSITKETHLAHVIVASSDGYFIERIYNESKLKKTSEFLEIDYLDENDVKYWLDNLEKESAITEYTLTNDQKRMIWENFGGSVSEISRFLGDILMRAEKGKVPEDDFNEILNRKLIAARSQFVDYADIGFESKEEILFEEIYEKIKEKDYFTSSEFSGLIKDDCFKDKNELKSALIELVRQNFISYNPVTAEYKLQGKSMEIGLKMYVEMQS